MAQSPGTQHVDGPAALHRSQGDPMLFCSELEPVASATAAGGPEFTGVEADNGKLDILCVLSSRVVQAFGVFARFTHCVSDPGEGSAKAP
jgi:hypothetical protein